MAKFFEIGHQMANLATLFCLIWSDTLTRHWTVLTLGIYLAEEFFDKNTSVQCHWLRIRNFVSEVAAGRCQATFLTTSAKFLTCYFFSLILLPRIRE